MRAGDPTHKIEGKIITESKAAIKINCHTLDGNDWNQEHSDIQWIPFSQIAKIDKGKPNSDETDTIHCSRWILQQKGLI